MGYFRLLTSLTAAMLLAVLWSGCGAAGAEDDPEALEQARTGEQAEAGFFERILEPEPVPVTVPAGTVLAIRLMDTLSSHETPVGAAFAGEVTQEISVDGEVAVATGSVIRGHVLEARAAKKIGGRAILSLAFDELETVTGETVAVSAHLAESGRSEVAKDAAIIGGGTIGGAIIGEAIHEGEGGTVGAIVGGIAGTVGALKTKGKPVLLPAGTMLHITLDGPFTVEVR